MAVHVTPLGDRILVKRVEEQDSLRNGLYIPQVAKERPQEGEVIAVGKGRRNDKGKRVGLDVLEGDRVLFGKYSGSEIRIDEREYLILREEEIFAKLD